jgi:hypothetical protein
VCFEIIEGEARLVNWERGCRRAIVRVLLLYSGGEC